ncbi:hypothetical protein DM47_1929 [Burkholderia mallei]|nr:hypothetical protein DM46_1199 [Burkholderia mallei]KOT18752.1 hypothetical protein DM47_1929 [Burkholderia mallei]
MRTITYASRKPRRRFAGNDQAGAITKQSRNGNSRDSCFCSSIRRAFLTRHSASQFAS